ncbi:hypothetical protein I7I51_06468 [Histoplasma capsulatum]|uniref:Uncharacterized protein n=1 Tax=Ajellomyces capsulatus TaxID=5037 RepID=A0A8A1MLZ7_AJECA|nr:hypothetical protein I7I51_06468 [Histoplasma capsulatum]
MKLWKVDENDDNSDGDGGVGVFTNILQSLTMNAVFLTSELSYVTSDLTPPAGWISSELTPQPESNTIPRRGSLSAASESSLNSPTPTPLQPGGTDRRNSTTRHRFMTPGRRRQIFEDRP